LQLRKTVREVEHTDLQARSLSDSLQAARCPIHRGKWGRVDHAVDLVHPLEPEKHLGNTGRLAKPRIPSDAVISDALGDLPLLASDGARRFHRISHQDEKTPLILTTHLRVGE
jgi:hypothetical protein